MIFIGLFLFEVYILYLLSRKVINIFWLLIYSITRNQKLTVYLLALLFIPGTYIHELAHWITAKLLFVHTGKMSLWPKTFGTSIKFGSVSIAKTDPVRRILIGTSPVFVGISLIITIIYFTFNSNLLNNIWLMIFIGFIVFDICNTMFSSKKDLEGAIGLLLFVLLIASILYILGIRIPFSLIEAAINQPTLIKYFQNGIYYMFFPIIVDSFVIIISKLIYR